MVRLAVCQVRIDVDDSTANRHAALDAVRAAALGGAQLVVLPELANSGYVFRSRTEALSRAESADGVFGNACRQLSAELGIVLVAGFCEQGDSDGPYNSALVVDCGTLLGVYRKTHLWGLEKSIFTPGSAPAPVWPTSVGQVGVVICYDLEFPEVVRDLAVRGAQLVAAPSNWPAAPLPAGEQPIEVIKAQAAAATNRVHVAVADRCGTERGVEWFGASLICGVDGFRVAGPGAGQPVTLTAEVDLAAADDKSLGPDNDALADLRPEVLAAWSGVSRAGGRR